MKRDYLAISYSKPVLMNYFRRLSQTRVPEFSNNLLTDTVYSFFQREKLYHKTKIININSYAIGERYTSTCRVSFLKLINEKWQFSLCFVKIQNTIFAKIIFSLHIKILIRRSWEMNFRLFSRPFSCWRGLRRSIFLAVKAFEVTKPTRQRGS